MATRKATESNKGRQSKTSSQDIFAKAGLRAARWFANSQVNVKGPYWDANFGRFIYNRHVPSGDTVLGLSWTQGRGIFTLLAAYELSGDESLLPAISRGAAYLKLLQIYDCPDNPRRQFAIRENMPLHWFSHVRDATEGAMALLYLYRATRDEDYLRRAVDYSNWFAANGWDNTGWPYGTVWLDRPKQKKMPYSFQAGDGPFFYYLAQATGQKRHLANLRKLADRTLAKYVRQDGAVLTGVIDAHHSNREGVVYNDDGLMVALLCAHLALGGNQYLNACLRHAHWLEQNVHPPLSMLSGLPCMCNFMIQLAQVTGEARYRDWAGQMLKEFVLPLQVKDATDPMSDGAFRGEDEPVEYYGPRKKTTPKTDFITTRMTCYSALACLKMCGIIGPYYGATGWDRKLKRVVLPAVALD